MTEQMGQGPADKLETPPPARRAGRGIRTRPWLEAAAIVLLALACVFMLYGHRWMSGRTVFRGAVQEQYYLLGQYAFDHRIIADFSDGCFPLWNHLNALGTPLLGNMLSGVFYPLKPIIYVHDTLTARDAYLVLRLLLAALFTWALCRRLRLTFLPSAVAAMSFAFSGYMKMFVNENYLNADVLLPAALLFTLRLMDGRRLKDFFALFLVVFAVVNNGHPEAAFYTLLLPAFVAALSARGPRGLGRAVMILAPAFAVGIILSLPMVLPFLEYWSRGYHFHVPGAGFFHYSARQAAALVSPWFYGPAPAGAPFLFTPEITWPSSPGGVPAYSQTVVPWLAPSLGAAPLFLAALAGANLKKLGRIETSLLIYAVFFIGVVFGLPLFRLLGGAPLFSFSGNFKHPLPGVALGVAVLAGRGLQMVLEGKSGRTRVANTLTVFILAVISLGMASDPLPSGGAFLNRHSLTIMAVTLLLGAWLAGLAPSRPDGKAAAAPFRVMAGLVALAVVMVVLVVDGFQQPMRDPGYEQRIESPQTDRLLEVGPLERVYISQDISPPNMNILFGLADIRVMDGVNDRRLVRAINAINGHDRARAGTYWYRETGYLQPMPDRLGHPILRLFGVGYALMDGPLPYNRSTNRLLAEADITAPGPEYVGQARLPLGSATAPGLLAHPPSRIEWRHGEEADNPGGYNPPYTSFHIKLAPALSREAAGHEPDGAWLMFSDGLDLAYARHIFPRLFPREVSLAPLELGVDCIEFPASCRKVVLYSLPGPSRDYDHAGWSDFRAGGSGDLSTGSWELLSAGRHWLYRDRDALPRSFLVSGAVAAEEDDALAMISSDDFDPRSAVLLSGQIPFEEESPAGKGLPGNILSVDYGAQRVMIETEMWRDGWLVLSDLYYPGWKCLVNGAARRIFRGDFCLRAVRVEAGARSVEMSYEPASFRLGLFSFVAVMLSAVFVIIFTLARGSWPGLTAR